MTGAGRPSPMVRRSAWSSTESLELAVEHLRGVGEPRLVVVGLVERAPVLGEQLAGQVADGHRDVAVPEVDAGHHAGAGGQLDRRAAASAAWLGGDQPGCGQLAHDVRDGGRGQPGHRGPDRPG